ncbi:MAG: hypothetical protein H0Z18_07500 [Thermococcus sp.]|uniref:hypothetical protein n=1 Tax=Thermococcus sp. TaxID=35749 RepID=UPI001D954DBB|nr:hypothetical protein [Thermococcus sp.]MBO8175085.1 hypothetical protein [Thermococcus sp.]
MKLEDFLPILALLLLFVVVYGIMEQRCTIRVSEEVSKVVEKVEKGDIAMDIELHTTELQKNSERALACLNTSKCSKATLVGYLMKASFHMEILHSYYSRAVTSILKPGEEIEPYINTTTLDCAKMLEEFATMVIEDNITERQLKIMKRALIDVNKFTNNTLKLNNITLILQENGKIQEKCQTYLVAFNNTTK